MIQTKHSKVSIRQTEGNPRKGFVETKGRISVVRNVTCSDKVQKKAKKRSLDLELTDDLQNQLQEVLG